MIEHIVLFKWKEDAAPQAIAEVLTELRGLKTQIDGITGLTCGANFSERAQGFTHALVVRFDSRAALDAYGPHPAHQRVVQNYITPIRADILALDYEF
jgi:hypothetical protein